MERKQVIPTQSKLLQLYFIRHGETEWSLSGQHTGRTDIPLTARGEDEARELGPHLREIEFARVLTSPRQRARRTYEPINGSWLVCIWRESPHYQEHDARTF